MKTITCEQMKKPNALEQGIDLLDIIVIVDSMNKLNRSKNGKESRNGNEKGNN